MHNSGLNELSDEIIFRAQKLFSFLKPCILLSRTSPTFPIRLPISGITSTDLLRLGNQVCKGHVFTPASHPAGRGAARVQGGPHQGEARTQGGVPHPGGGGVCIQGGGFCIKGGVHIQRRGGLHPGSHMTRGLFPGGLCPGGSLLERPPRQRPPVQ